MERFFKESENDFAKTVIQSDSVFISGSRVGNEWRHTSGPEKGQLIYTTSTGQCLTFCDWALPDVASRTYDPITPSPVSGLDYLSMEPDYWEGSNIHSQSYALVEFGGLSDPIIPAVATQGGDITISNFVNDENGVAWDMSKLSIQILSSTPSADYSPVIVSPAATSVVVTINPGPISGTSKLQITDGSRSVNIMFIFQLTISGSNFGTDKTSIKLSLGMYDEDWESGICSGIAILEPHTAITCVLGFTARKGYPLTPIYVQVGSKSTISKNDEVNMRVIRMVNIITNFEDTQKDISYSSPLDFNAGYQGVIQSAQQADFAANMYPVGDYDRFYEGLIGLYATGYKYDNNMPNNGMVAINATFDGCEAAGKVLCKNDFLLRNTKVNRVAFDAGFEEHTAVPASGAGSLTMYGQDPIAITQVFKLDTAGGNITFVVDGSVGFRYTKRSYTIGGVVGTGKIVQQSVNSLLIPIPAGINSATLAVKIANFSAITTSITYNPPTITSISQAAPNSNGLVTVVGTNLGASESNIAISFGATACSNVKFVSPHTSFTCTAPTGKDSVSVYLSVGTQSTTYDYTYLHPLITLITQSGDILNIVGTSFGNLAGVSTVPPSTPITLSPGPIQTLVAKFDFTTKNGPISISSSGIMTPPYPWSFAPVITSVTPTILSSDNTNKITISGMFFNFKRLDGSSATKSVTVGTQQCVWPSSYSNETAMYIECSSPAGSGSKVPVKVTIDGVVSNIFTVDYAVPTITSVTNVGPLMVIQGTSLGSLSTGQTKVVVNGIILNSASVNSTTITAVLPLDTRNGRVSVQIKGEPTNALQFDLVPLISSVSAPSTDGGIITLNGNFFNYKTFAGAPISITVDIAKIGSCTVIPPSVNTQLLCIAKAGVGKSFALTLTVGTMTSQSTFSYRPPAITNVIQVNNTLEISGNNWGTNYAQITVNFGKIKLTPTSTDDGETLVVDIPATATNSKITVTVGGQTSNSKFFALVPILFGQNVFPPTIGGQVQIYGSHISYVRADGSYADVAVVIDKSTPCTKVASPSDSVLTCNAPAGSGPNHLIRVEVDGVTSNQITLYYMAPIITGTIVQNGPVLTITGSNFGKQASFVSVHFRGLKATAQTCSETSLTAYIPRFALSGPVHVSIAGNNSNSLPMTLHPLIESITAPSTSGGDITISGLFLNDQTQDGSSTVITAVLENGVKCTDIISLSDSTNFSLLKCTLPAGSGSHTLTLTIDGLSDSASFVYGAVVITSVTSDANNKFTLTGQDFGTDASKIQVYWGSTLVANPILGDNTIEFTALPSYLNDLVYISVDGIASNKKMANLQPTITQVTKSGTQGTECTITGSFLNIQNGNGSPSNWTITVNGDQAVDASQGEQGTSIIFTAPRGTGNNLVLTITINGKSALYNSFAYIAPTILNVIQKGNQITCGGLNLGNNVLAITTTPVGLYVMDVSDSSIVLEIQSTQLNTKLSIGVGGQSSNSIDLDLVPIISDITRASPYGGLVTISGMFLNSLRADDSNTRVSVVLGDDTPCTLDYANGSTLICKVESELFFDADILLTIDGQSAYLQGEYTSLAPFVRSATSLYFNEAGATTITGDNFIQPLSVQIGTQWCDFPEIISPTTIICQFNAEQDGGPLDVMVTVLDTLYSSPAKVFLYNENNCHDSCSNFGHCQLGYCVCGAGFAGPNCNIAVGDGEGPSVYTSQELIKFEVNAAFDFFVSIATITELDSKQAPVRASQVSLAAWVQNGESQVHGDATITYFTGSLKDDKAKLNLTVSSYSANSNSSYNGEIIPVAAKTIDHTMTIENWDFASPDNSLQVIYTASCPSTITYDSASSPVTPTTHVDPNTGNLYAFTIDSKAALLESRFSRRVYIDNKETVFMSVAHVPSSTPQANTVDVQVAITIPYFESSASFDPSFVAFNKASTPKPTEDPSTSGLNSSNKLTASLLGVMMVVITALAL
eukprot:gene7341-8547_t